jgi:transcription antitermination factor NusG
MQSTVRASAQAAGISFASERGSGSRPDAGPARADTGRLLAACEASKSEAVIVPPDPSLLQLYPGREWCALHTRGRHEKKVAASCGSLHIPRYLPLRVHRTFSGGKLNTFQLPMFAGYVFAALAPGDMLPLKQTNSVAQRLATGDQERLIRDLVNVLAVERAGVELATASSFEAGQRVVVARGPLAGVAGTVIRHKNRTRLQVAIEAIHQAVVLDVEEADLVPAS